MKLDSEADFGEAAFPWRSTMKQQASDFRIQHPKVEPSKALENYKFAGSTESMAWV